MIILFNKPVGTAGESLGFFLNSGSTVIAQWLSGTDPVNLQVKVGDNYVNALDGSGVAITLTPTTQQYTINGAATYRVTAGTGSAIIATATQGI